MNTLRILLLGDVVGPTGRAMVQKHIAHIKSQYGIDGIILNGENSASQGRGITPGIVKFFRALGVDIVTSGNHIWQKKDIYHYLRDNTDLIRPANFSDDCPGLGATTFECKGFKVGVMNVQGRVFMKELVNCPFKTAESLVAHLRTITPIIFVDMHAEATAEKMGMAYFLDGHVSAVVGTHTHVQTADERILPGGTAYITDLGMAGSMNSMIGMKKEPIIRNFLTQMPERFVVDTSLPLYMTGVWVEVDADSGKAVDIQRIKVIDTELYVEAEE